MKPKNIIALFVAVATISGTISWMNPEIIPGHENNFIRELKKKYAGFFASVPEERVYLQVDKPFYNPGETIWFAAYLRDGQTFKPSAVSDILHVELLNPKGAVEKQIKIIARNGKALGDFSLDETAAGGLYKLKAYTNWQKNDSAFFEKEIQVQNVVLPALKMKLDFEKKAFGAGDEVIAELEVNTNENKPLAFYKMKFTANLDGKKFQEGEFITDVLGKRFVKFKLPENLNTSDGLLNILIDYQGQTESVSRSIPIVLNKIKLQLLSEGGDLVNGLESHGAFRAVNEFGKPADIEGRVIDNSGKTVTEFKSFHQGMGEFNITPAEGQQYSAVVTKPEGIKDRFALPAALPRGYAMHVDNTGKDELYLQIGSTENEELSIVTQIRGEIFYATAILAREGLNHISIPSAGFPAGVAQVTLFDSKGVPRCERLVFVNQEKQLNIGIDTDKEKYLPREKVVMTISVKDERGMPMPAKLSLSVVNDQLLAFADDKSGNILSKLLLESDLVEKVEEPAFYFKKDERKSEQALDLLLLTSGWRRYKWERILSDDLPKVTFQAEKAVVAGTLMDGYSGKPVANAAVRESDGNATAKTDENGKFQFGFIDLSNPVQLSVTADGYQNQNYAVQDYNQNLIYYLYNNRYYRGMRDNFGRGGVMMKMASKAVPARAGGSGFEEEVFFDAMDNSDIPAGQAKAEPVLKTSEEVGNVERNEAKKGKSEGKIQLLDNRMGNIAAQDESRLKEKKQNAPTAYYRAKEFVAPVYGNQEEPEVRNDFRQTIFWSGNIDVDRTGKKAVEFYNSDDISSFRATVEGIASDGMPGRAEKTYFTQLPFAMTVKIPVEAAAEDLVSIPLTIKNNSASAVPGILKITAPSGLAVIETIPELQTVPAGKARTIYLKYRVKNERSEGEFAISFKACGLKDAFAQKIKIVPRGFPVTASFSGNETEGHYVLDIENVVKGSIKARFTAFPSVVSDLLTGVDAILQEPYGCFEQTSMTSYPNAMVMDYLKTTGTKDDKLLAYAGNLLDKGYKRLTSFETPEKGYEWFGQAPGHEGLTAYGLMQFSDLKKVYDGVDEKMIDRTAQWILSHKDGRGGFARKQYALHNFGMISEDIMNGYIVYALAEAGFTDLKKEMDASYENAMSSKDPYRLAMAANVLYKLNDNRYEKAMNALLSKQENEGGFDGTTHSITYSTGQSLRIETTSLAVLAMLKSPGAYQAELNKAVEYIVKNRSGYGSFGNSQGTVLALKALTEYAKANKKTPEDGTIEFFVDGNKVAARTYKAGNKEPVLMDSLEQFIGGGKHNLKVKYVNVRNPLPYTLTVSWNTSLPAADENCKLDLKTRISSGNINQGETVRLNIAIKNKTVDELPSPVAIIGIPAGLSVQPWQLKELQEKKVFDYYEARGNNVIFYYRGMAPSDVKEINLDLKADIPGEYEAPASSAYLYYTNEYKDWAGGTKVKINPTI